MRETFVRRPGNSIPGLMKRSATGCAFSFFLLIASFPGWSGSIQLSPVRTTLSESRPVEAIRVKNHGTEPSVIQLEPMAWSQQDGKDIYVPTREIIATPPIFTVPAGGTQVVRVGLRRASDPRRELAYRLYFQEVPPPAAAGFQGLQVALRLGMAVFVSSAAGVKPEVRWSLRRGAGTELALTAANTGAAHLQLASFTLASAAGEPVEHKVGAYLLPGQSREWPVRVAQVPVAGAAWRLIARTDAGELRADLVLE
jgi:fimbrial chaperone protein